MLYFIYYGALMIDLRVIFVLYLLKQISMINFIYYFYAIPDAIFMANSIFFFRFHIPCYYK